jgi:hypothetical protein
MFNRHVPAIVLSLPQGVNRRRRPRAATFMPAKRAVIRLQLEITAKKALDDLSDRRGMTQIAIMSRVVHWLVAQDEVVQASVLGLLSQEALGDMSQVLLKRLAARASDSPPGSQPPGGGGTRSGLRERIAN